MDGVQYVYGVGVVYVDFDGWGWDIIWVLCLLLLIVMFVINCFSGGVCLLCRLCV